MKIFSKILHLFFGIARPLTIGTRCIVHDGEGSVMLVRHTYVSGWHLPGGGVDVGETCEAAVIREVAEESIIDLTGKPVLFGVYLNSVVSERDHVILYISSSWSYKQGLSLKRLEIAESTMFNLTDLPIDIDPSTRQRLDEWSGITEVSLIW
ncbi:NUDIX domain-containing protein [Planktomarina sp.]|nr:NUDIX domain-containing protein [Planktomarina sp.]